MLQNIRDNAQGTIAKIIVILIILTFAIFGTDAIIQSFYGEPEVAEVNGEAITQAQFERMVERKRRQVISQMGADFDPSQIDQNLLRRQTLDEAVQRTIVLQAAEGAGLVASEAQIDEFITQWPAAQREGRFDPEQFRMILANVGLTPLEFRRELRGELVMAQLQGGIVGSAFVAEADVLDLLRLERQRRDFRYLRLDARSLVADMSVTEEEIAAFYEAHKEERFRLPERVILDFLEVRKDDLAAREAVDEAEVEARYQSELDAFTSTEQRRASHILLERDAERSPEQMLETLRGIRQEVLAGKDFAAAAREYSKDIGTAADGGSLGLLSKGAMGDERFDEVLFGLAEGEISEPVETTFGYHLIRLEDIVASQPPEREEAISRIRQELLAQKTESRFVEVSTRLVDLTYSAADLQEASAEFGIPIKTSEPLSRNGGEGLWSNPRILEQAFSDEVLVDGNNSEVVEVGRDTLVVLRRRDRLDSMIQPLDDVRAEISGELALGKAKERLRGDVAAIKAGAPATIGGEGWQTVMGAGRASEEDREVLGHVFGMKSPTDRPEVQTFETADGFLVVALDRVEDPDPGQLEEQKKAIQPLLASRTGNLESLLYLGALEKRAEIVRNP